MRAALLRLRPVLVRPGRLFASVLGVAVGVAAVVSTVAGSGAAVASLSRDVERLAGGAVLEVRGPGGVPFERLADLAPVADAVELVPVVEDTAPLVAPGTALDGTRVRVLGLDLLSDPRLREAGAESSGAVDGADDEGERRRSRPLLFGDGALVPTPLAEELGAAAGDALALRVRGARVDLEVVETVDPGEPAGPWARTIVVDVGAALAAFDRGPRYDRLELHPREGVEVDLEALRARVDALLAERAGGPLLWAAPPSARRAEGERLVSSLRFNLTALSGVSMLVGVALVATTLATSVVQRRDRLALMRSLGASRAQLASGVLGEAAIVGLLGGALGVGLGALGARAAVDGVRAAAYSIVPDALESTVRFESWWLPAGVLLGLGAALLAALLPLREAVGVPPVQGLRAERPTRLSARGHGWSWGSAAALAAVALVLLQLPPVGRRPVWALSACVALLAASVALAPSLVDLAARVRVSRGPRGVALRLAQAALASSRGRAAWAAGAVAIAVGLAIAMATMVGSFRRTIVDWTNEALAADLFVSSGTGDPMEPEVVDRAVELFGAERVGVYRQADARTQGERVLFGGANFAVDARFASSPMVAGGPPREAFARALETGGALVNEPFARRFDAWIGDQVELATAGGPLTLEVVGVLREYSGQEGRVVVDVGTWAPLHPRAAPRSMSIYLPQGTELEAARADLAAALAGTSTTILVQRELFDEVLAIFERTFAVTTALQLLASIAAALAVVTVLGALVRERRFDLAVVRVVGAARSQVTTLVLGEAFVLGVVGAGAGTLLGVAVGWILVTVVNVQSHGWSLSFVPPWTPVLVTAAAVVPACVVAGLPPAIGALVRPPREVLRETG